MPSPTPPSRVMRKRKECDDSIRLPLPRLTWTAVTQASSRAQVRPTANVYVDGFNLYYGCLRHTSHKWLDLDVLCRRLLPAYDIHRIRYFTARVSGRSDPRSPALQATYLRALRTLPAVTIHFG